MLKLKNCLNNITYLKIQYESKLKMFVLFFTKKDINSSFLINAILIFVFVKFNSRWYKFIALYIFNQFTF